MIAVESKLAALEKVYSIYHTHTADLEIVCTKGCAQCCSTDVTLSTLEGYYFWLGLDSENQHQLARLLESNRSIARFQPSLTTNELAEICAAGGEPPEEKRAERTANCPLLSDHLCTVYQLRPFHCRCMFSRQVCKPSGWAEMADFTLTLNSVFLQVIEHLDTPGCTGNLLDVLELMFSSKGREKYENGSLDCRSEELVPNRVLTKLMVPPEYQSRLAPILKELQMVQI